MKKKKETDYSQVFNPKLFLRTFSYREVLSSFTLAVLNFTFIKVLKYSDIHFSSLTVGFIMFIPLTLNHVLYKIEHKRSNNFIGRNFQDYIFLIFTLVISAIYVWYKENSYSSFDPGFIISFIFFALLFECLIALVKRILNLMKWRIL